MPSSKFFQVLANEAIMGIMAFDPITQRCQYINKLAREILEISNGLNLEDAENPLGSDALADSVVELDLPELYPQEARAGFGRPFSEEILKHDGLSQDVLMRKKNGHLFIANVGIKHVDVGCGDHRILVMFQDTTIQKKLQREVQAKQEEIHNAFTELLEQNRQLKELDLAKDKFIALTTHELRTPLSAIVATAEVVQMRLYESEEQKAEFIKTIHEQSLHLMELVNDVLDFAKIRAGKMEYYVEHVELLPMVKKLVANFEHMAEQAEVTTEVAELDSPIRAYVDVLRLKEVVNNVVNNAIKYNRPQGTVLIKIIEREGLARIAISDTGQGIPADKIASVFNEFETVGSVSRHHKGTGLGMPISKRLVQGMGGDLTLESVEGEGSTFFIDVPMTKVLSEEHYRERPDSWGDLAA
jgi:signal transduction histidine kinase